MDNAKGQQEVEGINKMNGKTMQPEVFGSEKTWRLKVSLLI